MIRAGEAWTILGIEPTSERRAIRKAYAARLKAIDPDSDIAGFQRLRQALEMAERHAKHGAVQANTNRLAAGTQAAAEPEAKAGKRQPKPAKGSEPAAPDQSDEAAVPPPRLNVTIRLDPLTPPEPPPPPDPAVTLRNRFQNLLARRKRSEQDEAELLATFDSLLADERMEGIDFADQFENWLAGLLNSTGRRADTIVPLAVERFGWHRELDSINPRYAQAAVARRAQDLRCIMALSDPGHQWHEAYAMLSGNGPHELERSVKVRLAPQVQELLESLNWHNPGVYQTLNRARLHEWEVHFASRNENRDVLFKSTGISWWTVLMAIWFFATVARLAFQDSNPVPEPLALPPPVETVDSAPAPAPFGGSPLVPEVQSGPSAKDEEFNRELDECLSPRAPDRSSNGRFDCHKIREFLQPGR